MSLFEDLEITAMGAQGEGLTIFNGQRLFVPFCLPGEKVKVDLDPDRPELDAVLEASPERIDPICPHFGECGGCQLQHWSSQPYAAWKRQKLVDALSRHGLETQIGELVPAYGNGRRRATLHATPNGSGFTRRRSHDIHVIDQCPILVPALERAPEIATAFAKVLGNCDVSFTAADNGLDVSISIKGKVDRQGAAKLARTLKIARLAINGEMLALLTQPIIKMGKANVPLPIDTFLQATFEAEEVISAKVVAALSGAKRVADLFCGVGPFALRIAEMAQVYGVDSSKPAVAACNKALEATPGLKTLGAEARDLFRDPLIPIELKRFDAVVFDPPRAGAQQQAEELARSKVKRVIAVSCDPETFARDAGILIKGGYKLKQATPVDQFAFSSHLEIVAEFRR